jgi:N-acetyl sugar amidotransferase
MERFDCKKCLMDKTAEEIVFTETGCNFCDQAEKSLKDIEKEKDNLLYIIKDIKKDGEGKKYDCLIGLSGGVDSSFTLHKAVELGLRPLCFSVDNGWHDPKADENIMKLVEGLKVPYYRYTIDLDKFRDLQSAFILAGQRNIEIPTDHILLATTYDMANKYDIKYILSGGNVATESIMPQSWGYNARDLVHVKDVYKKMKGRKLKGLPVCGLLKWNWYKWVKKIKMFYLLDYVEYDRRLAITFLEKMYGYKNYGEKHCENYFTWWFQNFYLYEKFGIDKRKAHLSSLVMSRQLSRKDAERELMKSPVYPDIGFDRKVLNYEERPYNDFKTDEKLWKFITTLVRAWRKLLKK